MRMHEVIIKKREGQPLTTAEIEAVVNGYTKGSIPDYQMAAWLMAIYFQGMSREETAALTMAMARSGKMLELNSIPGIKVDKHSTGGVADTTTLILAPLVAAAGIPVAKMSGRGLGFTGGTIDKLEAIPGFQTTLSQEQFIANVQRYQVALTGQSQAIAPADGKIYALRDVTGTVESIPLIASSIMSKKIAAGADKILLDVKVGKGAFMKRLEDAIALADTMVQIGKLVGRETKAIITSMEEPLGQAIGNSLEVEEAMDVLSGKGIWALREVCLQLGAQMAVLGGKAATPQQGYQLLEQLLVNGKALERFRTFIAAQGGNAAIIENRQLLPQAAFCRVVSSKHSGYIAAIDAAKIGYAAMRLGAGREYKGQEIDLATGIMLKCRVGDYVVNQQELAVIYANDEQRRQEAEAILADAIQFVPQPIAAPPLFLGTVTEAGFQAWQYE